MISFHADYVHVDEQCRRLSFAEGNEGGHYLIIDRTEESSDETLPDMSNVYIELDDQGGGGFGGIELVELRQDHMTVQLNDQTAIKVGDVGIHVGFAISDSLFEAMSRVVRLIMKGYESQLDL